GPGCMRESTLGASATDRWESGGPPWAASVARNAAVLGSRAGHAGTCIACCLMVCSAGWARLSHENTCFSASSDDRESPCRAESRRYGTGMSMITDVDCTVAGGACGSLVALLRNLW